MASTALPLIEQQREELIAHHCLEVRERKLASGLLAHALKQAEATFVGDTVGHADVEKSADRRLARTALRNVPCQLLDPVSDEGAIDRIDARPVTWRRVGGLKASQRLQDRRAVNGMKHRLQGRDPACRRRPSTKTRLPFPSAPVPATGRCPARRAGGSRARVSAIEETDLRKGLAGVNIS